MFETFSGLFEYTFSFHFHELFCIFVYFQLVDEFGKVRGWLDASQRGTGNWMKFIRSSSQQDDRNLMAMQVKDQVSRSTDAF